MAPGVRHGRRAVLAGLAAGAALPAIAPAAPMVAPRAAASPGLAPVPLRLSLNENPFGPSPAAARALAAALPQVNRYGDQAAVDVLLDRIVALEGVAREQIVLGEILAPLGLFLAAGAAAGAPAGGRFVYSAPGYTALVDAGRPLGAVPVGVPLDAALRNDLPALSRAATGDTRALYLVNPHNPSGTTNDPASFERFLREVSARTLVVVDEAYLEYDDMRRSAVALTRAGANVAVFRTLDKIYGLAGLPVGYLLAPRALAGALRATGLADPHDIGRLALAAAAGALGDQDWVRQVRGRIVAGRTRLTATLDRLGLRHSDSHANFVFFQVSPTEHGGADRFRRRLAEQGLLVGKPFPPLNDWIRISVGTEAEVSRTIAALQASAG
ncbi:pyridoxal phosphate-dependent aminotransferase [Rhizosaccharibacter radicis]|uniref:Histidinol-phosphate aminotransferase family protein n=1 Tax=Rhizosaccharibacter radicis TaxID=2782605 RepID=A0ABT1W1P5_9PROT|nr:histidinol-phosphate aminotransferase family protein [Acetobacteraceae bacterium KSS12]